MDDHTSRQEKTEKAEPEIERLEKKLAELEARMPAHSVPPVMIQEQEELEEKLAQARRRTSEGE